MPYFDMPNSLRYEQTNEDVGMDKESEKIERRKSIKRLMVNTQIKN